MKRHLKSFLPSIDDIYLEDILDIFLDIDTFCHTIDIPSKGLIYTGITLIPPLSFEKFCRKIESLEWLHELTALMKKASKENKFIIHYGL